MEARKVCVIIECNNDIIEASVGFEIKTDKKMSEIKEFYRQIAPVALYSEQLEQGAVLRLLTNYLIDWNTLDTIADKYKERLMKKMKESMDKSNKWEGDFEKDLKIAKEAIGVLEEMVKLKK